MLTGEHHYYPLREHQELDVKADETDKQAQLERQRGVGAGERDPCTPDLTISENCDSIFQVDFSFGLSLFVLLSEQ